VAPAEVRYLFATHVHLDHAGGMGALAEVLPRATVLCPPGTMRHLVDPARLVAGAGEVFGERMQPFWGEVVPVPTDRIEEVDDGRRLDLGGGRKLLFLLTPGHTRRHLVALDEASGVIFAGDTAGLQLQAPFVPLADPLYLPSLPPADVDPEALVVSVRRLLTLRPTALYLAHYGRVEDAEGALRAHEARVRQHAERARGVEGWPRLLARLTDDAAAELAAHGVRDVGPVLAGLALDLELNARGLSGYWRRQEGGAGERRDGEGRAQTRM
jgi:glyoxylase-like metal-dependent hydrolase (beta-lactamase superfamily II)